jgi:hypothetical protein
MIITDTHAHITTSKDPNRHEVRTTAGRYQALMRLQAWMWSDTKPVDQMNPNDYLLAACTNLLHS